VNNTVAWKPLLFRRFRFEVWMGAMFLLLFAPAPPIQAQLPRPIEARGKDPALLLDYVSLKEEDSGTTDAVVHLRLTAPTPFVVHGLYLTQDGTATVADRDYEAATGSFSFEPNSTTSTITVHVNGDTKVEPNETFYVQLAAVENATTTTGPGRSEITILNDDTGIRISIPDVSKLEGNSGSTNFDFAVTLSAPSSVDVTGAYRLTDDTATARDNDFVSDSGSFTIRAGQRTATISVRVTGDSAPESDERFFVDISGLAGVAPLTLRATGTILNDDFGSIDVSSPSVEEGDSGTTDVRFRVALAQAVPTDTNVKYQTVDGTATVADKDYQSDAGSVIIPAGQTFQNVAVRIAGDTRPEPDETFTLMVTANGISATGTATIVDDDRQKPSALAIVSGNNQHGTAGKALALPFVVRASDTNGKPVVGASIRWSVSKGSATVSASSTTTDSSGTSSTIVTLGSSTGEVAVISELTGPLNAQVTFAVVSDAELASTPGISPVAVAVAKRLDELCNSSAAILRGACGALSVLPDADRARVLEQIAPQQSGAQAQSIMQGTTILVSSIASRLSALRGGATGFSIDRLSMDINGKSFPVAALVSLLNSYARGGGAGDPGGRGLSGFVNGTIGHGTRPAQLGTLGFDLKHRGVTAGLDRRVGNLVVGGAVSWMSLKSNLRDSSGNLDTKGYSVSLYGMRTGLLAGRASSKHGGWSLLEGGYVEAIVTYGRNEYLSQHLVDIPGLQVSTARSRNHANVLVFTGGGGVESNRGAFALDTFLRGSFSGAGVAGFDESGGGALSLGVRSQQVRSLLATTGFDASYSQSLKWGVLRPDIRVSFVHDFEGGSRLITAHFLQDPAATPFTIPIDHPDRNYGNIAAGLQALMPHGYSSFLQYSGDVGRSDLHFYSVQLGLRKEF
jgi:hypothetical protein